MKSYTGTIPRIIAGASMAALLACSPSPGGNTGATAGVGAITGPPVTLKAATPDSAGRPSSRVLDFFATEVARLSDGVLTIEPVWEAGEVLGPGQWDQAAANVVATGAADIGLVPARAFDELGVTSLQALQAPFLIDDEATMNGVASDEGLVKDALSGLPAGAFVGLALWPEGVRHLVSFGDPFLTLDDLRGARVRVPFSNGVHATLRAIGAEPWAEAAGERVDAEIESGELDGADTAFTLGTTLPRPGVVTGNIGLYSKLNVLIANPGVYDKLSEPQRQVLRDAAAATLHFAIESNESEVLAARAYCTSQGGAVVLATDGAIEQIRARTDSVYAGLNQDALTKDLIGRIEHIRAGAASSASTARSCGNVPESSPAPQASATVGGPPNGVYRNEITVDDLLAAGVEEGFATENAGILTLALTDGGFTLAWDTSGGCAGRYTGTPSTLTLKYDAGCTGDFTATWKVDGDQLRFEDVQTPATGDRVLWSLKPWIKVG